MDPLTLGLCRDPQHVCGAVAGEQDPRVTSGALRLWVGIQTRLRWQTLMLGSMVPVQLQVGLISLVRWWEPEGRLG